MTFFVVYHATRHDEALRLLAALHDAGEAAIMGSDRKGFKEQLGQAHARGCEKAILILEGGETLVRDMKTGEQQPFKEDLVITKQKIACARQLSHRYRYADEVCYLCESSGLRLRLPQGEEKW